MRFQINVSRPVLRRNQRGTGAPIEPPIIVRDLAAPEGSQFTMARAVAIHGPVSVLSDSGGTSVWVETDGPMDLIGAEPGLAAAERGRL